MSVLLGLTLTHARSKYGSKVYHLKPFYRGAKITVVGAISLKKVVGIMTLDGSMDNQAFSVFIKHFLVPNIWDGAVVVMDHLPAHKRVAVKPLIETETAPLSSIYHPILRTLI